MLKIESILKIQVTIRIIKLKAMDKKRYSTGIHVNNVAKRKLKKKLHKQVIKSEDVCRMNEDVVGFTLFEY